MLQTMTLLPICLTLFDGGDGGTGGADSGQGTASVAGGLTGGAETAMDAPDAGEESQEERKARYKAARQEFKDLYEQDTQRMLDRRFKETKDLQDQLAAVGPVMDILFSKYGVSAGDMDALEDAINEDITFWADAAEERGMTVEQYKEFSRMERELRALNADRAREAAAVEQAIGEQRAQQQLQQWYMEGEALKATYPSFDLERESENPVFLTLLKNGFSVENAYESAHIEEIKAGVAASTAKAAEKQITANIKARGSRPTEAGTPTGVTAKFDPAKLDKKGRAELIARAARGETISF